MASNATHESIVRQAVKRKLDNEGPGAAITEGRLLSDKNFIENVMAKKRRVSHPFGHSVDAVGVLKVA